MTSSLDPPGEFRVRRRRRAVKPINEINVTPFVDVMLVLLIVFMVTAPLLSAGVPIDLPDAPASPLAVEKEPVSVSVDPDGRIFVMEEEVTMAGLVPRLNELTTGPEERIYVRGDRSANYGMILQVMGTINVAGFTRIGLISEPQSVSEPVPAADLEPAATVADPPVVPDLPSIPDP